MFENFKRKRVPVGDVEIACVIGGEGPPVLMLHGYPQSLAMWVIGHDRGGRTGHRLADIPAQWRKRCTNVTAASLPGGHFFVDQFPGETAEHLLRFLGNNR